MTSMKPSETVYIDEITIMDSHGYGFEKMNLGVRQEINKKLPLLILLWIDV